MSRLLLLIPAIFIHIFVNAQKGDCLVHYMHSMEVSLNDNSTTTVNGGNIDAADSLPDEVKAMIREIIGKSIQWEVATYILASPVESKTFFTLDGNSLVLSKPGMNLQVRMPDTLYYKNGTWTSLLNDSLVHVAGVDMEMSPTMERKQILGYECQKFVSAPDTNGKVVIFWATPELPNTLLPFTGLKGFPYGILEVEDQQTHSRIVAMKVQVPGDIGYPRKSNSRPVRSL